MNGKKLNLIQFRNVVNNALASAFPIAGSSFLVDEVDRTGKVIVLLHIPVWGDFKAAYLMDVSKGNSMQQTAAQIASDFLLAFNAFDLPYYQQW